MSITQFVRWRCVVVSLVIAALAGCQPFESYIEDAYVEAPTQGSTGGQGAPATGDSPSQDPPPTTGADNPPSGNSPGGATPGSQGGDSTQPPSGAFVPPVGIPAPPFGIAEAHTSYRGRTFDYGAGPSPYRDAGHGPYTHYVDNTSSAATDSGNPFGTAAKPRRTIPTRLPAGSVVEIHGGPYRDEETIIVAEGTVDSPVFLRGINKPRIDGSLTVYSSAGTESRYAVIESFSVHKIWILAPASYIACRDNEVRGDASSGGIAMDSYDGAYANHHIVIYRNSIRDNGNWQADYDQDVHGVTIARHTNNVWVLDNEMYHNSGDGLQINAGSRGLQPHTHHIYVGRNLSHHNKQAGLWTKQAVDVIFSQNTVHGLRPVGARPSAFGAGMGFQYAPQRVWFLYNHVYDCCFGISAGAAHGDGSGQDSYYVGNLIHDIRHDPVRPYDAGSVWSSAAISLSDMPNKYIVNNTIYNCDAGINAPSSGRLVVVNNIIAGIVDPQANHVFVQDDAAAAASSFSHNLLFQNGASARIRWGGDAMSLPTFQAATGKGAGCLTADPLFANPAGQDLRLLPNSPAIDAGAASDVFRLFRDLYGVSLDRDGCGTSRPQGDGWDIGACESASST